MCLFSFLFQVALELFFILEIVKGFHVSWNAKIFLSWKKFWTVFLEQQNALLVFLRLSRRCGIRVRFKSSGIWPSFFP